MNYSLVGLGRKDVGSANCHCVDRSRAFLEGGLDRMAWLQFVQIYPNVLRYGRIGRFRLGPDRCSKRFRQHGCGWFESVKRLHNVLVWNLRGSLF